MCGLSKDLNGFKSSPVNTEHLGIKYVKIDQAVF